MKKLITLLLVLTGMVTTANAATVYVKSPQQPNIWAWVVENSQEKKLTGNDWPGAQMTETVTIEGETFWKYEIENYDEFNVIFSHQGSGWNKRTQTVDIAVSGDTYYDMDFTSGTGEGDNFRVSYTTRSNATISKVTIKGDWTGGTNWTDKVTLTKGTGNVYTGTLDLSDVYSDVEFKLVANDGSWVGMGSYATTVTGPTGWISGTDNIKLANGTSGYKTYTVTATWTESPFAASFWNIVIAGDEVRPAAPTYTVTFVNGAGWENVYGYAFHREGGTDTPYKGWTDIQLEKTETTTIDEQEFDVYTFTIQSYTFVPSFVIFHNGSVQTADFTFENNAQYTYGLPAKYVLAGESSIAANTTNVFPNGWEAKNSTQQLTKGEGTLYTYTLDDVTLSANEKLSFKVADIASTAPVWYPANNVEVSVSRAGVYDIVVVFDASNGTVTQPTPVMVKEPVTITSAGWATTVTNQNLDFSGEADFEAYTATVSGTTVTLTKVDNVQAETGLVLRLLPGKTAKTFYVPVIPTSTTDKGSLLYSSTDPYDTWHNNGGQYNQFFGLAVVGGNACFAEIECSANNEVTIPAGKAFLLVNNGAPGGARELSVVFDNESTGINTVEAVKNSNNVFYNLAGQRVVAPAKGLYIVNGKKVMMK